MATAQSDYIPKRLVARLDTPVKRISGQQNSENSTCIWWTWLWVIFTRRRKEPSITQFPFLCFRYSVVFVGLKRMLLKRGTGSGERGEGNGERKSGNELSAETSTKIQNGGPKHEREKEDKERNLCLGWNQVGTKLQIRLTFYVYVLSRWYVFSIFNLFHLQYDKVLGLSFRDTWHTHITPGLLRLL